MSIVFVAVVLGAMLLVLGVYFKLLAGWRRLHQGVLGGLTLAYGMWLALFTGTVFKLVLPGIGAIALGSVAGASVGFLTYLAVGVVGVVTGGVGVALGALSMTAIGALLGGIGGAAGGVLVRVPIVSPIFWGPVLFIGVYLLFGALRKRKPQSPSTIRGEDEPL